MKKQVETPELECGCIINERQCPKYARLVKLEREAYRRKDIAAYAFYNNLAWEHLGIDPHPFSKGEHS